MPIARWYIWQMIVAETTMRLAAEQLRLIAPGASPGSRRNNPSKLRSSDGRKAVRQHYVAAPQLFCSTLTVTCGFTAGYQPPLLRSESQHDSPIERNKGDILLFLETRMSPLWLRPLWLREMTPFSFVQSRRVYSCNLCDSWFTIQPRIARITRIEHHIIG